METILYIYILYIYIMYYTYIYIYMYVYIYMYMIYIYIYLIYIYIYIIFIYLDMIFTIVYSCFSHHCHPILGLTAVLHWVDFSRLVLTGIVNLRAERRVPQRSMRNSSNTFRMLGLGQQIIIIVIWQCVKTLYPCSSHQNSWDLWMFIPLKMVCIGIDP